MSKVCEITQKKPMSGNHVSHAHNTRRRRFLPNLQTHRIFVPRLNRYIKFTISTAGLRLIDKIGIEAVLQKINHKDRIREDAS